MINNSNNKIKYYQQWYGEKCPYKNEIKKRKEEKEREEKEREYLSSISRGIPLHQQYQQLQQQKQNEIILGPKKYRPRSALPSTNRKMKGHYNSDMNDEIGEENAVLTIRYQIFILSVFCFLCLSLIVFLFNIELHFVILISK